MDSPQIEEVALGKQGKAEATKAPQLDQLHRLADDHRCWWWFIDILVDRKYHRSERG